MTSPISFGSQTKLLPGFNKQTPCKISERLNLVDEWLVITQWSAKTWRTLTCVSAMRITSRRRRPVTRATPTHFKHRANCCPFILQNGAQLRKFWLSPAEKALKKGDDQSIIHNWAQQIRKVIRPISLNALFAKELEVKQDFDCNECQRLP